MATLYVEVRGPCKDGGFMKLQGSEIVVRTILEQGVNLVFGYPGGTVIDIYDALYKHSDELHHVLVAHEQNAAHAADGYARATGKVGVCIATSGPGSTNLVTGIATAFLDSIPLVAITGNVPTAQIGTDSFQELDITGVTLPITKHNYFVDDIDDLADAIREAFKLAASGRPGPVLVDIAKDVQQALGEYEPQAPLPLDDPKPVDTEQLAAAAEVINTCHRPLIYFGGGAISAGAEQQILELAKKADAPIACSLMGLSAVPTDHPRFLGMEGMHGHYASTMAMKSADCIIALGARFNDRSTGNRTKFAIGTNIVHIDIDGSELSKTTNDTFGIIGDVKESIEKLVPMLNQGDHRGWRRVLEEFRSDEKSQTDLRSELTPRNAIIAASEKRDPSSPVVTDVGQHQMWAAQYMNLTQPRTFITSGGLGTMGFGLPAAIGASLATGKHAVLVVGDGGFGMSCHEMATAVANKAPVVILLLNNGVLGMVRQWQNLFYEKRFSNTVLDSYRSTDFVALAKAFGADGRRVESMEALDFALDAAFATDGPYLIDVRIDKDEFVLPMLPPGGTLDDIIVRVEG